jgi:hypothetical protein
VRKHEVSIMLNNPAAEPERPAELSATPFAIPTWPIAAWPSTVQSASWNGKLLQCLATLAGEWLDFLNRRLKEDVNLAPRLAACRSPDEISKAYVAFWQKLVDDYWKEFAVLGKLGGEIAASRAVRLQSDTPKVAADSGSP